MNPAYLPSFLAFFLLSFLPSFLLFFLPSFLLLYFSDRVTCFCPGLASDYNPIFLPTPLQAHATTPGLLTEMGVSLTFFPRLSLNSDPFDCYLLSS
jgi:hypothetical protein